MRRFLAIASVLLAAATAPEFARAQAGEGGDEAPDATASDTDPESDADTDTESDADPESEDAPDAAESDTESDTDTDTESDADAEPVPHGGDELPPEMRPTVIDDTEPTAQPEAPARPMRIVGRLGVGGALRLVAHDELQQDRLAPSYLNLQGALVLPLTGSFRHSVLVGASTNLEADGSFVNGVDPFAQWVIEAGYGLHVGFGRPGAPTWLVGGHVSGALVVSPDVTWGFEIGGDAAYHFLAGLGVYAELNVGTYFGAEDRFGNLTVNPLLALEVGLTWDYEVLP